MGLLDLPTEIRLHIYSELLDVRRSPITIVLGRRRHQLHVAILRVHSRIYKEAIQVLRDNGFVKLLCTGPAEFAPGVGLPAAGTNATKVKRATIAVAEVEVNVLKPHRNEDRSDYHLITTDTLGLYFEHLAARQITTFPSTSPYYRQAAPDEDAWWVRYDVTVTILPPPQPIRSAHSQLRSRLQLEHEERFVYTMMRGLRHVDNRITLVPHLLPMEAKQLIIYLRSGAASGESWIEWLHGVTAIRKIRLDGLYVAHGKELAGSGGDLLLAFRDICLDMQFLLESCELADPGDVRHTLGSHRGRILTLMCAVFHSYTYLYYHHDTTHLDIWPFHQPCRLLRCICLALAQTDGSITSLVPSPDLEIPITLWHHMQHLAILLHDIHDRSNGRHDLAHTLFSLETLVERSKHANADVDSYLRHDVDVVQSALVSGLRAEPEAVEGESEAKWRLLWSRSSVKSLIPRLIDSTGHLR